MRPIRIALLAVTTAAVFVAGCGGKAKGPTTTDRKIQTSKATYDVGTPMNGARAFLLALRYQDEAALSKVVTESASTGILGVSLEELRDKFKQLSTDVQKDVGWGVSGTGGTAQVMSRRYTLEMRLVADVWQVDSIARDGRTMFP
jgi:hypothetical protein